LVRARVDATWEGQLGVVESRSGEAIDVLAALPITFGHAARAVQAALRRVHEDLAHAPFAVFYALVTDARRGGRIWYPPRRFVENGCYTRATFDAIFGHLLEGCRRRRRRFGRSVALSDLGLSAMHPTSLARLDTWLERGDSPQLGFPSGHGAVACDWFAWATSQVHEIERRRERLLSDVRESAVARHSTVSDGARPVPAWGASADGTCRRAGGACGRASTARPRVSRLQSS
jgi:hypothetical protein